MAAITAHTKYQHIARPYARAAFEQAKEAHQLPLWKTFLESAVALVTESAVEKLLATPEVARQKTYEFFNDTLKELYLPQLTIEQRNFIHLLAEKKRLILLPEINHLFDTYYRAHEKTMEVRVVTAISITDEYKQKLIAALTRKQNQEIILQCEVDPTILGGAVIYMGDKVIDGSIRGKLTRLLEFSLR